MKRDLKRGLMVALAQMCAIVGLATEPKVTDVVAKQRYPWNGLVDITCKVSGIDGTTNGLKFAVAVVMPDTGNARTVSHFWIVHNGTNSIDRAVHTNGDYRLLWDARSNIGKVAYSNVVMRVTLFQDAHIGVRDRVQLWEGGPYWATTNIGADEPWESGFYFWWGDTVGYKRENDSWVASDGSSSNFSFSSENTPTYGKDIATLQSEGWITTDNVLAPAHDAACVQWGGNWRMPAKQEFDDLLSMCDWNWTTTNGVNGWVVRGRDNYASASVFLPAAGNGKGPSFRGAGSGGYPWSSVPDLDNYDSWYLYFVSGLSRCGTFDGNRYYGSSVRPVQGFTE